MVGKVTPDNIITASRVPALLNASPYETPNDVLKTCIDAEEGVPRDCLLYTSPSPRDS